MFFRGGPFNELCRHVFLDFFGRSFGDGGMHLKGVFITYDWPNSYPCLSLPLATPDSYNERDKLPVLVHFCLPA